MPGKGLFIGFNYTVAAPRMNRVWRPVLRWTYIAVLCILPAMKFGKDLVAASAVPLILSILQEGESYGYAIIRRVHELSGGQMKWTDGMLYPVLHRLEAQGVIVSRWKTAESGRRRKYYAINRQGRKALEEHKAQWRLVNAALATMWG